ncbi:hypothetical protein [Nonomuraea basaltis]|uniref:hypothetical protein n=1 Tax=Nonomuraea basaltis TaxID=2495887 RepID=UPI00110C6DB4|nr:hypothetical protein [Nonomuraea basaltis]TMR90501.1 hypothetical protein EJK15_54950 [Nonomuraea basaltis]
MLITLPDVSGLAFSLDPFAYLRTEDGQPLRLANVWIWHVFDDGSKWIGPKVSVSVQGDDVSDVALARAAHAKFISDEEDDLAG